MLVVTLGVGAVALTLWFVARADWHIPAPTPAAEVTVAPASADRAPGELVPRTVAPQPLSDSPLAPLPPLDTPLADSFDELVARADRGDPQAACRLALELQVCDHDLSGLKFFADNAPRHASIDPGLIPDEQLEGLETAMINAQAQIDAFDIIQAHCRGAPEVDMARRLGWWRQSALAGSRAAMHELMGGTALPINQWMRHTDHLAWMRRELEPLAWRAVHAGDLETAWTLMGALTPQPSVMREMPLAQVTQGDGETALALAVYLHDALASATGNAEAIEAMREGARMTAAAMEDALTPGEQARARAAGREWSRTITPLPVNTSPFARHMLGQEPQEERQARMQLCSEPG